MEKVAKFEKVSFEQFQKDIVGAEGKDLHIVYKCITFPVRATAGSAGYDIFSPVDFTLKPGESIRIATGLRCKIGDGWAMFIMPKSGLGFKYRLQLDNTIGLVDADYYYAKNEGHILVQITNDSKDGKILEINEGKAFAQCVFLPFGITFEDQATAQRVGGFGSTNA